MRARKDLIDIIKDNMKYIREKQKRCLGLPDGD